MVTVQQLLGGKTAAIHSIDPDATVFDAIRKMAECNIGALLVMQGDNLVGIISERDYARNIALKGKSSTETAVADIMTREVVCVSPQNTTDQCMAIMTNRRIRHLPVLDDKQVIGVVSIGDLVQSIINDQKFVIDQLVHYIHR